MESCKASGYGLIADAQFLKFDKAGDEMALAFLEATKKEAHLSIKVKSRLFDRSDQRQQD
tara:strand:- start:205 stop:384 length:180 start_codon:yes stop_codon:yes gene_type:complete